MPTPTWQAATTGQLPRAAHVTQLLGSHASQILYAGVQRAAQTTAGTGNTSTNGLYLAQSFTTASGQTAIGYVMIQLESNTSAGANLPPTTVGIYANSGGAPTGSALVSATLTAEYSNAAPANVTVPVPVTGLTASTTYWIVAAAAGSSTYSFSWNKSNQASGASTSANGSLWNAASYGFLFQVYDQTVTGQPACTWDDSGARWTWTGYTTQNQVSQYAEYTSGQTNSGYLQSFRTFTYTSGLPTGVS
jgi:hypothetical protein